MERNFGGEWALEVQTPRNLLKNPRRNEEDTGDSGFIDGAKVTVGQTLKVEVVEVKARSEDGGGCTRATGEALRYIGSLKSLAPLMVPLSERLAAAGGLRVDKGCQSPNAGQRRTLIAAGVDFNDQVSLNAWCFYNSLQVKLKRVFTTPFSKVDIIANADGVKDVPYDIQPPILINCPTGRKANATSSSRSTTKAASVMDAATNAGSARKTKRNNYRKKRPRTFRTRPTKRNRPGSIRKSTWIYPRAIQSNLASPGKRTTPGRSKHSQMTRYLLTI